MQIGASTLGGTVQINDRRSRRSWFARRALTGRTDALDEDGR